MKRVLDVGNCGPDHGALVDVLTEHFNVEVTQVHGHSEALDRIRQHSFDLVTVNRLMDRDGSSGLEIIKAIKQDADSADVPVMLISNYDSYQQDAENHGAEPGFGKATLRDPKTVELFQRYLG